MSPSNILVVARRFFNECWNEGRLDVVDELLAPEHVHHFANQAVTIRTGKRKEGCDACTGYVCGATRNQGSF